MTVVRLIWDQLDRVQLPAVRPVRLKQSKSAWMADFDWRANIIAQSPLAQFEPMLQDLDQENFLQTKCQNLDQLNHTHRP